mmetsp:Transcript_34230/g.58569  ORF Transcript_34230/g.58569 Transcript_34230/m.58569 type:complete len:301 (+) Transcript_34230:2738-3640(+)
MCSTRSPWSISRLVMKTTSMSLFCTTRFSSPDSSSSLNVVLSTASDFLSTTNTTPARCSPSMVCTRQPPSTSLSPGRSTKLQPPSSTAAGTKAWTLFAANRCSWSLSLSSQSKSCRCLRSRCRSMPPPRYRTYRDLTTSSSASQTLMSLHDCSSSSGSSGHASSAKSGKSAAFTMPSFTRMYVCHARFNSSFLALSSRSSGSSSPRSRRSCTNWYASCCSSSTVAFSTSPWIVPPLRTRVCSAVVESAAMPHGNRKSDTLGRACPSTSAYLRMDLSSSSNLRRAAPAGSISTSPSAATAA